MSAVMEKYLQSQIEQRRQRLQQIERDRITVAAELRAYEDMLHQLGASEDEASSSHEPAGSPEVRATPPTSFKMSTHWVKALRLLEAAGRSFSAGDMVKAAKGVGFDTSAANARSQIAHYQTRGYIRRTAHGRYALTPKGKEKLTNDESPDAGTPGLSNGSAGVAGSPSGRPHQAPSVGSTPTTSTALSTR